MPSPRRSFSCGMNMPETGGATAALAVARRFATVGAVRALRHPRMERLIAGRSLTNSNEPEQRRTSLPRLAEEFLRRCALGHCMRSFAIVESAAPHIPPVAKDAHRCLKLPARSRTRGRCHCSARRPQAASTVVRMRESGIHDRRFPRVANCPRPETQRSSPIRFDTHMATRAERASAAPPTTPAGLVTFGTPAL